MLNETTPRPLSTASGSFSFKELFVAKEQYAHYIVSYEVEQTQRYYPDPEDKQTQDVLIYKEWVSEFYPPADKAEAEKRFNELRKKHNVRFMGASMIAHHQPSEIK